MKNSSIGKRKFEEFETRKQAMKKDAHFIASMKTLTSKKLTLTDDLLFKNEQYIVNPTVFCKKVSLSSLEGASPRLVILENLLRIVCQSYYKSEFSIGNLIQEIQKKGTHSPLHY
jgi:hypothetical protein